MTAIEPFLFGPAERRRFGIVHRPSGEPRDAVLICSPMGQEQVQCHRCLAWLAGALARAGYVAMRFDYAGTADSDGSFDEVTFAGLLDDTRLALDELQRRSGFSRVAMVGMRLGATVALSTAAERDDVSAVILWNVVIKGRAHVRALKKYNLFWRAGKGASVEVHDGFESLGFIYPPAWTEALMALNLLDLSGEGMPPILVLTDRRGRDTESLVARLSSGGAVVDVEETVAKDTWLKSYDNKGDVPERDISVICDWMRRRPSADSRRALPEASSRAPLDATPDPAASTRDHPTPQPREEVVTFGTHGNLIGVLTQPGDGGCRGGILLPNSGFIYRIGPSRLFVTLSRLVSREGLCALRFDLTGIGDSEPWDDSFEFDRHEADEVADALQLLHERSQAQSIVVLGMCSSSEIALGCLAAHPHLTGLVRGLLLVNPHLIEGNAAREYSVALAKRRQYLNALAPRQMWKRVKTGRLNPTRLAKALVGGVVARRRFESQADRGYWQVDVLTQLAASGLPIQIIFSEESDAVGSLAYLRSLNVGVSGPLTAIELVVIPKADHVFASTHSQRQLIEHSVRWMRSLDAEPKGRLSGSSTHD